MTDAHFLPNTDLPTYLRAPTPEDSDDVKAFREMGYLVRSFDFSEADLDAAAEQTKAVGAKGFVRAQDLWRRSEAVRRLAANPSLLQLLTDLHGRRAFPFQTLNFAAGSQQKPHSDTYHFSSEPGHFMVGVWLALEDIHPDSGPLEYYPGSHQLPIYNKRDLPGPDYAHDYEPFIAHQLQAKGFERKIIAPKRGEALIWGANLVHGGSPIQNEALSRLCQVTHYYFDGCAFTTPMREREDGHHIRSVYDLGERRYVPQVLDGKSIKPGLLVAAANRVRNLTRQVMYF